MTGFRLALALSALVSLMHDFAVAEDKAVVHYTMWPVMRHGALSAVVVEIRFRGEADGETKLLLPKEWGGETDLWRALRDIQIKGDGVRVALTSDPAVRIIEHPPNADITVSYRVIQDRPGEPSATNHNPYRPVIQPGYFHLIGDAIFAMPDWDDSTPSSFEISGLPKGWRFASDLESGPLTLKAVAESISVGGDFRVVIRQMHGASLRVAIRGHWKFSDDSFTDQLVRIVVSHTAFWRDPEESYLVTVLPESNPGHGMSLGGTGRGGGFAFFASENAEQSDINRVLAHEHIHTWIPKRIGRMPEKDEARDYWLSEGFTEFYTARLLVRDKIWTIEDFAAMENEMLAGYASSAVRTAPNSLVVTDFWKNNAVGKLPYQRGFLLAAIWDQELRAKSRGLRNFDDVMLAMKARYMAVRDAKSVPLAVDNFMAEMRAAGVDPADDVAHFVDEGAAILLPADLFAVCGIVSTVEVPEFTRGFDADKTSAAGGVVTGIDVDGPAYAAGMRDGMKIIKREAGKLDDSRVEIVYRISDKGAERIIHYKPEGKKRVTLQEFALAPGLDQAGREACAMRLGGA